MTWGASATGPTEPVDHESMALPGEALRFGEERRHAFQAFIAEFRDGAAGGAEEMFVVWDAAGRFIALEAFAEIAFDHKPAADEDLESTIDRGGPGARSLCVEGARHLVSRHVSIGAKDHLSDRHPLRGHREVVIPEVGPKGLTILGRRVTHGRRSAFASWAAE